MKQFIQLIVFAGVLLACGSTKNKNEELVESTTVEHDAKPQRPYQTKARIGKFPEGDPVKILAASVTGNTLSLEVSYSGGCGMHDFEFIGSEFILKSMPPKRQVQLIHYNRGDQCESIVNQKVEVDIRDLSYNEMDIILLLKDWKEELKYHYQSE